jgi:hypothetical protein
VTPGMETETVAQRVFRLQPISSSYYFIDENETNVCIAKDLASHKNQKQKSN